MKIAFGICSLGIGHATRCAPIMRKLSDEGHEITVISHGSALALLKKEFPHFKFIDLLDFPVQYPQKAHQFIPYFLANSRKIVSSMIEGHREFLKIHEREKFDLILSDSRFDIFHRKVPSYLLIHQLRIMIKLKLLREGTLFYNSYISKFFRKILVPDFPQNSLSGEMSHNLRWIAPEKIVYIGPLTSFRKLNRQRDIDILVSISGPEPQRTLFEKKVLEQVENLDGKIVITLGKPDSRSNKKGNAEIHGYLKFEEREDIMNRAKVLISRSGYSTIMDMYTIGGKMGFVPTPGQPEQEYLAEHLSSRGIAPYCTQDEFDLRNLVNAAKEYRGFEGGYDVRKTLDKIWSVIFE